MGILAYGSPFYIASLALLALIPGLLWVLLRHRGEKTRRRAVLCMMLINAAQHLLKPLIYPHLAGTGFSSLISAYNMCAVVILASPLAFLWDSRFLRNFIFMGFTAGLAAIAVPYWFIGMEVSQLGWEYARFYLCHGILFAASLLTRLLGLHKPSYKEFWQPGLAFLLALCLILLNNTVFISLGLHPGVEGLGLYESLCRGNPCMMMGPPEDLLWLAELIRPFTPDIFLGENPAGIFVPILWYALPLYLTQSFVTFVFFVISDWQHFSQDLKALLKKAAVPSR